jgi:Na+-translocating ferredoxin:NAD+ oxidoreductase RnfC subunit
MKELCKGLEGFTVCELPSVYPQGAEKVLIESATGKEVPQGALPSAVGCIVMNVASVGFVARYMKTGMPLVTKRLTVDGDAVAEPKNVEVVIGTSTKDVIEFCGGYKAEAGKIISGGKEGVLPTNVENQKRITTAQSELLGVVIGLINNIAIHAFHSNDGYNAVIPLVPVGVVK